MFFKQIFRSASLVLIAFIFCNCAQSRHVVSEGPFPDIERGKAIPVLDYTASFLASPIKLLLWNRRYGTHRISPRTEAVISKYIEQNDLRGVKVRINQFAPVGEMKRIFANHEVGLLYRLIAVPFSLLTSATGRLLAGLIFSDYYDPFSNTVHVFSDDTAIALHELGHAKDFSKQKWKGTYALVRSFPGVNLAQEMVATHEAFDYLELHGSDEDRIRAPRVLYPAFATYAGSYLQVVPFGWVGALAGGHIYGRIRSKYVREDLEIKSYAISNNKLKNNPPSEINEGGL